MRPKEIQEKLGIDGKQWNRVGRPQAENQRQV